MTTPSATRQLRAHSDIHQLRRQAKELLASYRAGDEAAMTEVQIHYRGANPSTFALHDAQLVLARAYGFESWPKLKAHVDGITAGRLCDAVRAGDNNQVRALLNVRPELVHMELPEDGRRALHFAVLDRNPEMVRLLMQHGADPHAGVWPHQGDFSPCIMAKDRGYDEIVEAILEEERRRPADSRPHDPNAWPADGIAAAADEARMIEFLEKNPEFINVPYYMLAPLHVAAARLSESLMTWLLDHGANVNLRDRSGPSPLELVGCMAPPNPQRAAAMASLLQSLGAEMTPHAAVTLGNVEWLRARHAAGRLPDGLHSKHRGLLELAVFHRRPDILKLLLDLGFDPDEPVPQGEGKELRRFGPLLLCARRGETAMAEVLLVHGATLTPGSAVSLGKGEWLREHQTAVKSEIGLMALAIQHNHPEMVALLLDLGLDPNGANAGSAGGPLRECAKPGRLHIAKLLLDRGANPNAHGLYEWSALYEAYTEKNPEMVQLLTTSGAYLNAAEVGYMRQAEIASKMLAGEIDPHFEDSRFSGNTTVEQLLNSGANTGDSEIVRMTLAYIDWPRDDPRWLGALSKILPDQARWNDEQRERYSGAFRLILERCNPNLTSNHGETILHAVIAADFGDGAELAKMLLDAGARTDVRDDLLQSTPLGWACRWGRVKIAKLLLERGADPVEAGAETWATPMAWANKNNQKELIGLLVLSGGDKSSVTQ